MRPQITTGTGGVVHWDRQGSRSLEGDLNHRRKDKVYMLRKFGPIREQLLQHPLLVAHLALVNSILLVAHLALVNSIYQQEDRLAITGDFQQGSQQQMVKKLRQVLVRVR